VSGWERLRDEIDEYNRLNGDKALDGYVGLSGAGYWYGGTAYDGESMEETAVIGDGLSDPDTIAGHVANRLKKLNHDARAEGEQ